MSQASRRPDHLIVPPRPPETVMRLERMGSFHQTRLSFMRGLMRRMKSENWAFDRPVWRLDKKGVGVAVYTAQCPDRTYSLVCFSHDLDPELHTDRSIATAWDATFTLFDGIPSEADIARLSRSVPKQEAGRVSGTELSISRANRSVRLFGHTVARLAAGLQPDTEQMDAIGYLMRTTAVYGSGKFGAASRDIIADRPELKRPFQVEMLSVYLTRAFTADLVEYLAKARSPETAVPIEPSLRRKIGVGNSTGLGMAPFLVTHPILVNNWMAAREEALARVRSLPGAEAAKIARFESHLAQAKAGVDGWATGHEGQTARIAVLRDDLERLTAQLGSGAWHGEFPWDGLYRWGETTLSLEGQELLVSLLIEPHGDLVDDLIDQMIADESAGFSIDGAMKIGELKVVLADVHGWALDIPFDEPESQARYWYVLQNKLEPRLGERVDDPQATQHEVPLSVGRDMAAMARDLENWRDAQPLAHFLLRHPEYRHVARRAQIAARHTYAEIRDNLLAADMLPIDLLRCKLSFFGAVKFDPRSDRWVRINMFQNAPYPHELASSDADEWIYPSVENAI
ncbi:MAG: hypothetical protein VW057_10165 [Rhodospirillaceae bacterium]